VQVAFDNVVENAVEHSCQDEDPRTRATQGATDGGGKGHGETGGATAAGDADDAAGPPLVRVSVTPSADAVAVRVVDDGPGIPAHEVGAIGDEETALEHGSGLGLWVTDIVVSHVDGDLSFDRTADGGTAVTITLRRPDGGS
jgi:signal transduction histidine kinase